MAVRWILDFLVLTTSPRTASIRGFATDDRNERLMRPANVRQGAVEPVPNGEADRFVEHLLDT
jgi:hypothetical protein